MLYVTIQVTILT